MVGQMHHLSCENLTKKSVKNLFITFLSLILLGLSAIALAVGYGAYAYTAEGPLTESKLVLIKSGSGVKKIAQILKSENIIQNKLVFEAAARFDDAVLGNTLKAGEYEFPPYASMVQVLKMMEEGEVFDRKITIAEGLTVQQIIKRLNARQDLKGDITAIPKEGSLLPNTYHFIKGATRQDILNKMQSAMTDAIDNAWEKRVDNLPFKTKNEALVLASIVEKETAVASERSRIAGVFVNRLRKGMPLQTDPTVIYAITKGNIKEDGKGPLGRRLLTKDLQFDSPYNTYRYAGLPPGPIANPGIDSIKATLAPEENDYIYFVADGTGGHAFGKTLAEHNANVAKWRKIRN